MKHVTKQLFSIAMLLSAFAYAKDDVHGTRSVAPVYRSSQFTGNGLLTQANHCCEDDSDSFFAHLSAGVEYSHSMQKERLASYFVPSLATTTTAATNNASKTYKTSIAFGAEAAAATDVFSLNFWLPTDHVSTVTFNPKFYAVNTDLRLHVGLGEFVENLWLNVDLPIVHACWDLGLTKSITTAGTVATGAAKFGTGAATLPYTDPILAMAGDKSSTQNTTVETTVLTYGKFSADKTNCKKTKVGNTLIALGMDFIKKDNAQLGLGVLGVINGDEVSNAKYVNTPVIGNGGRHGVGLRLDGSVRLWENNDTALSAHLRADGAYIFDATVRRSFDFTANGTWSRYLLLKKHTDFNHVAAVTNAVNVTSLQAKIGKFLYCDVNLMFSLTHNAWEFNVGYNLGGVDKERLTKFVDTITPSTYTFFSYSGAPVGDQNADVAHAPTVQIDGSNGTKGTTPAAGTALTAANLAAQTITNDSLNKDSGLQPRSISHRVYGNLGYCYDKNEWMPSFSVGGSAEFSADNKAVRIWGVHGTFGICF